MRVSFPPTQDLLAYVSRPWLANAELSKEFCKSVSLSSVFPAQQSLPFLKTKSPSVKNASDLWGQATCRQHLIVSPGEVGWALVGRFSSASAGLPLQQIDLVCVKTCLFVEERKPTKKSRRIALLVLFFTANQPDVSPSHFKIHLCRGT